METYSPIIIVGAGAAGLFASASFQRPVSGLILEGSGRPGKKLTAAGGGQCNFTNAEEIRLFPKRYGPAGPLLRKALYRFSNQAAADFFEERGVPSFSREDGKVFPRSQSGRDILRCLLESGRKNGFSLRTGQSVEAIERILPEPGGTLSSPGFRLTTEDGRRYRCRVLILAAGGCSLPSSGSDGRIFPLLRQLGLSVTPLRPALAPVFTEAYPYGSLAGTSFGQVLLRRTPSGAAPGPAERFSGEAFSVSRGGLLLTHRNFSGPAALNLSRSLLPGDTLTVNYLPEYSRETLLALFSAAFTGKKQLSSALHEALTRCSPELSRRFTERKLTLLGLRKDARAAEISKDTYHRLIRAFLSESHRISRTGGWQEAMATCGGVALSEVDLHTFECKKIPRLLLAGEILDVDGDTGGYNLQFAFSSGFAAARRAEDLLAET